MKRKNPPHTWVDNKTGELYAVFTCTDRFRKRKYYYRKARNASHAKELYKALEAEHKQGGTQALDGARLTFDQLVKYVEEHYVKPPVFVNGLKVSGMKSYSDARQKLKVMRTYFGTRRIRSLTAEDVMAFRDARLATTTRRIEIDKDGKKKPRARSIASVQRELSLLRRVLNIARRKRWIPFNPFDEGGFISNASEVPRTRVISRDEETRLLLACEKEDKNSKKKSLTHLRPIIICGIDTGMRSGEMFKLLWQDVDLNADRIKVIASNTKNEKPRSVPVTERLHKELETLWENSLKDLDSLVFGVKRIKRGWASLCDEAGVLDATPHSLRHTAATRMIEKGMRIEEVGRILGHSSPQTTYRYINATDEMVGRAGAALDSFNDDDRESIH